MPCRIFAYRARGRSAAVPVVVVVVALVVVALVVVRALVLVLAAAAAAVVVLVVLVILVVVVVVVVEAVVGLKPSSVSTGTIPRVHEQLPTREAHSFDQLYARKLLLKDQLLGSYRMLTRAKKPRAAGEEQGAEEAVLP